MTLGDAYQDHQPVRAKRNRTQLVCTECHRLKIKCDKVIPCSKCVKRGIADKCRIESKPSAFPQDDDISNGFQVLSFSSQVSSSSPKSSASEHVSSHDTLSDTTTTAGFSNHCQQQSITQSSSLDSLLGVIDSHSPKETSDAIKDFLCCNTHDRLLQAYFEECHWFSEILYVKSFETSMTFDWPKRSISEAYSFTSLLLAIHSNVRTNLPQWCTKELFKSSDPLLIKMSAKKAQNLALGCVERAKQLGSLSVEALQAMILIGSCRKEECDMSGYREILLKVIHEAQLLNYHLDPDLSVMTIAEGEKRRKLWLHLYRHDRFASLLMCIPTMIGNTKVKFPVLLLDGSILPASGADPSSPEGLEANEYTDLYCVLLTRLADIAGKISEYTQGTDVSYSETLIIDKDIQIFEQTMPRCFGMKIPTRNKSRYSVENKQRYVIYLIIFTMRYSVFQNLLIRSMASTSPDDRTIHACQLSLVHSAMTLIQMYKDILQDMSQDSLQWGIFVDPLSIAIGILLDAFLREPPTTPSNQSWLYYKVATDGRLLLESMSFPGSRAAEALSGLNEKLHKASQVVS